MKLFTAPAYAGISGLSIIHNGGAASFEYVSALKSFIDYGINNLIMIFKSAQVNLYLILLLMISSFLSLLIAGRTKENLHLWGLLTTAVLVFFTLIVLYTGSHYYLEKQLAFIIPILCFILVSTFRYFNILFVTLALLLFPTNRAKAVLNIKERREMYISVKKYEYVESQLRDAANRIKPKHSEVNILFCYTQYEVPNHMIFCYLPVSVSNVPLLYTTNVVGEEAPLEDKFKVFNRIRIDYVMSTTSLNLPNMNLKYHNSLCFLYEYKTH